ncbi:MFS transporter [Streptomyces tanashiensis]
MTSKLGASMTSLSLLLLVGSSHSYGTAGLAVSCSTLGQGLTAPYRGRLVDRIPARTALLSCLAAHLTTVIALIAAVRSGADATLICTLAAAVGASAPPVAVMMRAVWHSATTSATLNTAMSLDASMMGVALIIGPVLAGWLSLFSSLLPSAAVATMTVTTVALVVGRSSALVGPSAGARHWLGPLASSLLRRLLAADALVVMGVTAVDVVLPVYARQEHVAKLTGLYLGPASAGQHVQGRGRARAGERGRQALAPVRIRDRHVLSAAPGAGGDAWSVHCGRGGGLHGVGPAAVRGRLGGRPVDCRLGEGRGRAHVEEAGGRPARPVRRPAARRDCPTGLPDALHAAADALGDLGARASRSRVGVEVQSVTALTVWGTAPAECDQRAAMCRSASRAAPTGPCAPRRPGVTLHPRPARRRDTPAARHYVQHELGEDWAMHGALHGQSFGDPTGAMVGYSQDIGTISPVPLIADAPAHNASASFALADDLGGGKSTRSN